MQRAYQSGLWGGVMVSTGNAIRDQLAAIMEDEPGTIDDEDLLAAVWLHLHGGCQAETKRGLNALANIIRRYRKANIRERRRELKDLYPFSEEEEARRQNRGKGGPPG